MGALYDSIINPIAFLLGKILNVLFMGLNAIGIGNIAIAIIIFTFLVKMLMLPMTVGQAKMSKLTALMNPEIKAVQDKYKNMRGDQEAMLKMNQEMKAVYQKYGVSQMGGCVQLLIQFPILMALYRVIRFIPMYIDQIKDLFVNILQGNNGGIMSVSNYADIMSSNFSDKVDWNNMQTAVEAMNSFTVDQWENLKNLFPAFADTIANNYNSLTHMNTFLGINMSQAPQFAFSIAIIIPILSGLSQFISVKVMQAKNNMADSPMGSSMKVMNLFMPLMSMFIAFSVPAGLGLYWIATAVFQTIMQLMVNRHFDKKGVDAIVKENVEKRNKKLAKKGVDVEKLSKVASINTRNIEEMNKNKEKQLQAKKEANDKRIKDIKAATDYYKSAKPGSLAEKAGMVSKYNDKHKK